MDLQLAVVDGFDAFYSFCRSRSGYSGVAVFCRRPVIPEAAWDGLSTLDGDSGLDSARVQELDNEGRVVVLRFRTRCCGGRDHRLSVIAVYCPRLDPENASRAAFKADFNRLLQQRAEHLAQDGHVVIAGDLNVSHRPEDRCSGDEEVTPARLWFDNLLTPSQRDPELESENDGSGAAFGGSGGLFADNFRVKHPDRTEAYTCWNTMTGARETNYGTRIDFVLSDTALTEHCLVDCDIHPDVHGSDHCPVSATFALDVIPGCCPSLAAKFLPQFQGQRRISDFFSRPAAPTRKRPAEQVKDGSAPKRSSSSAFENFVKVPGRNEAAVKAPGRNETALKAPGRNVNAVKAPGRNENAVKATGRNENAVKAPGRNENAVKAPGRNENAVKAPGRNENAAAWGKLLGGPGKAPKCKGHGEPCVLRTVKKESANKGRQFWVCAKPDGPPSNPKSRCEHFEWVERNKT